MLCVSKIILWSEVMRQWIRALLLTMQPRLASMACIPLPLLLGGEVEAVCLHTQLATLCL